MASSGTPAPDKRFAERSGALPWKKDADEPEGIGASFVDSVAIFAGGFARANSATRDASCVAARCFFPIVVTRRFYNEWGARKGAPLQ